MVKNLKYLYLASIFILGLPTFYIILPSINSLNIVGIFWILILIYLLCFAKTRENVLILDKKIQYILIFFFIALSLSVIYAQNIASFLTIYKDIIFSLTFFLISYYFIKTKKDMFVIFIILALISAINIVLQTLITVDPALFIDFANQFFHPNYAAGIISNIQRGRIFLTNYDESLIPLLFYYLIFANKQVKKISIGIFLIGAISFFSLVTGFRTKIVMSTFAILGTFVIFRKSLSKILIIFSLVLAIMFILYVNIPFLNIQTGFERLFDTEGNIQTLTTGRSIQWTSAIDIGLSSPITGVGLGNYYDSLPNKIQKLSSPVQSDEIIHKMAVQDPHDIFLSVFAETGLLGFASLTCLFLYFLFTDIVAVSGNNPLLQCFILSFWTLVLFSLLNPWEALPYLGLFWLYRAIIVRLKENIIQAY